MSKIDFEFFGENLDQTGQHYMVDSKLIDFIVEAGNLSKDDVVLEIGYGEGALTKELVKCSKIVAVDIEEKDIDVGSDDVEIVQGNILEMFEKLHARHKFTKIISNIPYNISEPLMKKIFKTDIETIVLTMGKNFADIVSKKDNRIGIIANTLYNVEVLKIVKPISFNPRPKVDSAVVKFTRVKSDSSWLYSKLVLFDDLKLKNAMMKIFDTWTKKQVKEKTDNKLFDKRLYELSNKEFLEFDKLLKSVTK